MSERDVFTTALQIDDPAGRSAYLDQACAHDAALRRRVEMLLATEAGAGDFLERGADLIGAAGAATSDVTLGLDGASGPAAELRTDGERYVLAGEIARGGMGAVLRAVDRDIRREVAVKYLLDQADPARKLRFIEEAQITGQLEHPNIVPIHELAVDARQRLFFSMKMVRGKSLAELLDALSRNPAAADFASLSRLLTVFVSVCNAVAYAHAKGVIHRDLKPANVMVGEYGEVYVMDWGLAKVLHARAEEPSGAADTLALNRPETSRPGQAGLTQDGTILGTPAYIPPEQAGGRTHAVDRLSDVYSLGAILYAILALRPPVDVAGGTAAVLLRAAAGEVVRPEQRAPERARAGQIPRELSAVAMKALAKDPKDRYPSAEALRRDIERFQQGRSVSAKGDSAREMLWKLVRRNRGVSIATAAAAVLLTTVLAWSSWVNYRARTREEQAHAAYRQEQEEKQKRTRQAVPALVKAARLAVLNRDFGEARESLRVALDYDPSDPDARLLRAQMHAADRRFAEACADLDVYLEQRPRDANALRLRDLCGRPRPADVANVLAVAVVLKAQRVTTLADAVWTPLGYREMVDAAWVGKKLGDKVQLSETLGLGMNLDNTGVANLRPLEGIPFAHLSLAGCPVEDLQPVKEMPLVSLHLGGTNVSDLITLEGMKLVAIILPRGEPRGMEMLRKMKGLEKINGLPAAAFWKQHDGREQNQKLLAKYRNQLDLGWGRKKLGDRLNLTEMGGFAIDLNASGVANLRPLEGIPLTHLSLTACPVEDLRPLKGMPLVVLRLYACQGVRDLSPLKGMQLTDLNLHEVQATDLTPLKGMPLKKLFLWQCAAVDLRPLKGMPLTYLVIAETGVTDLSPLRGMPLNHFEATATNVTDIAPLKGMPLATLHLGNTKVADLTPLEGMKLVEITLPPGMPRGLELLRKMKSIEKINDMPAAEFWKQYDARKK